MSNVRKVTILGNGSYATALAILFRYIAEIIVIWGRTPDRVEKMQNSRMCLHLNVELPENVIITNDIASAIRESEIILLAVPSRAVEDLIKLIQPIIGVNQQIVICSKGLTSSQELLSDCIRKILPANDIFVLAGPALAPEIVLPHGNTMTVMDLAGTGDCNEMKKKIQSKNLFIHIARDIKCVQLANFKNWLSMFDGIIEGAGIEQNTQSGVLVMGIRDIQKIGTAFGVDPSDFMSFSFIGDQALKGSRNHSTGKQLGGGRSLSDILGSINYVLEGLLALENSTILSARHSLNTPVVKNLNEIIYEGKDVRQACYEIFSQI